MRLFGLMSVFSYYIHCDECHCLLGEWWTLAPDLHDRSEERKNVDLKTGFARVISQGLVGTNLNTKKQKSRDFWSNTRRFLSEKISLHIPPDTGPPTYADYCLAALKIVLLYTSIGDGIMPARSNISLSDVSWGP
jgi:hypothetical protein